MSNGKKNEPSESESVRQALPAGSPSDQQARYVVGVDLGTTNSAAAFVDAEQTPWRVETFQLPQLVAPGEVESRETLPSCHYQAASEEFSANALRLPWSSDDPRQAVGFFARDHGAKSPARLIASAKSWLCHSGVDRTANLLPWHGAEDVERLSPVEVSGRLLGHVRAAWNHRFPDHPLEHQDLIVTLPASFDEVARELTVKAAAAAGLKRVVLIEEPQAAFYAWIDSQGDDWDRRAQPGQKILVCDVGGGTTDFTLIRVRAGEDDKVMFHRVAVGDHLILGGDNLDLALARHVEPQLAKGGKLPPRQWAVLVRACRRAKETLLGPSPPEQFVLNVAGGGSRLIGGSLQVEIQRADVEQLLVEGFLPRVDLDDKPAKRQSGFQEFGLPYAPDSAVTRYLASFLSTHRHAGEDPDQAPTDFDPARPDVVLFNGGLFESPVLRERLLDVLKSWFSDPSDWAPEVLRNDRLDLAVARGAAYYGMVRRGQGVRISGGLARSYYIGVEDDQGQPAAMCLLPAGIEEGNSVDLTERRFSLLIRQPVEFPLFVSSTRLTDPAGAVVPLDPAGMSALPPIRTVLRSGGQGAPAETASVQLHARLTEIGVMDVWCGEVDGKRSWKLQFDVRTATQTDVEAHQGDLERQGVLDFETAEACNQLIRDTFAKTADGEALKPRRLVKSLEEVVGMRRQHWPPTLLRGLWEELADHEEGRRVSSLHEARWLNLLGFSLRPGYGLAVDDWRVSRTWRLFQSQKVLHAEAMCRVEWSILWRRVAGGLNPGQQTALAEPLLPLIKPLLRGKTTGRGSRKSKRRGARGKSRESVFGCGSHETAEIWRLLGSLELLPIHVKLDLGRALLAVLRSEEIGAVQEAAAWALGRLGSRVPMRGPLNTVVAADVAEDWAKQLSALGFDGAAFWFALVQLTRRTEDRYRDVSDPLRDSIVQLLRKQRAPRHFVRLVRQGGELDQEEQEMVFGESLPQGLKIQ
ncbi:MAG: hsp70 family protein [Planctomycetales bacterium]